MRKLNLALIFMAGILLWGINVYGITDKKETRNVPSFEEMGLSISADVYISQGNETSLVLEGDGYTLDHIQTSVANGKLKIRYSSWKWNSYKKVIIYITSPQWHGIYVSGSGKVVNKTFITSERLILNLSGSGDIELDRLKIDKGEARVSGSGSIKMAGSQKATSLKVAISGSGSVNAINLEIDDADVKISGSGNARVFARENLTALLAGSGNIYYRGDARIDARVSGSGKVRKVK